MYCIIKTKYKEGTYYFLNQNNEYSFITFLLFTSVLAYNIKDILLIY